MALSCAALLRPVAAQDDERLTIPLNEHENSGVSGTATLTAEDENTRVSMELSGDSLIEGLVRMVPAGVPASPSAGPRGGRVVQPAGRHRTRVEGRRAARPASRDQGGSRRGCRPGPSRIVAPRRVCPQGTAVRHGRHPPNEPYLEPCSRRGAVVGHGRCRGQGSTLAEPAPRPVTAPTSGQPGKTST